MLQKRVENDFLLKLSNKITLKNLSPKRKITNICKKKERGKKKRKKLKTQKYLYS